MKSYRYSMWDGTQDISAVDADDLMDAMTGGDGAGEHYDECPRLAGVSLTDLTHPEQGS